MPATPSTPNPALPSIFTGTRPAQTIPLDPTLLTAIDDEARKIGEDVEKMMDLIRGRMDEVGMGSWTTGPRGRRI